MIKNLLKFPVTWRIWIKRKMLNFKARIELHFSVNNVKKIQQINSTFC